MSNGKATFATVMLTVMFVAIEIMFYALGLKILFYIILSALAVVGLLWIAAQAIRWFSSASDLRLDPVMIRKVKAQDEPQEEPDEEILDTFTYDQIKAELGGDEG